MELVEEFIISLEGDTDSQSDVTSSEDDSGSESDYQTPSEASKVMWGNSPLAKASRGLVNQYLHAF